MCTQQTSMPIIHKQNSSFNYKLIIPREVEAKIRFICQQVWNTEWSGVLFYNYNGTFEDNTLEIICKDIYVMDVGNATYTEFSMSPDLVSYMANNIELLDYKQALIHSHSTFKAFFSGTDIKTLQEEGLERDNFVSLIVNNEGNYVAAITRKVTKKVIEKISYPFLGEGNKEYENEYKVEEIEWYDLKIIKEGYEFEDTKNRIEEIKANKAPKVNPYYNTFSNMNKTNSNNNEVNKPTIIQKSLFEDYDESFDINLDKIPYNKDVIDKIVLQLITGSILVDNNSKIDKIKWANSMPKFFNKAFKADEDDYYFKYWAEDYLNFLLVNNNKNIISSSYVGEEDEEAIIAHILMKELASLPENKYINMYIDILNKFFYS